MADNVQITAGAGTTIATDDAGAGGHVQLMKLALSADGSASLVPATAEGLAVQGGVAHDAADAGNPVGIGLQARTTNPTAVADADRARAIADKIGRQVVVLSQVRELVTEGAVALTNTTETTVIAAGGSGVFHDLTLLVLSNTSTGALRCDIRDSTGGTVQFPIMLAPGGGAVIALPVPYRQGTANNAWTAQLGSNPGGGDVRVTMQAVKNV